MYICMHVYIGTLLGKRQAEEVHMNLLPGR